VEHDWIAANDDPRRNIAPPAQTRSLGRRRRNR
jgi:hypothetical protein